MKERNKFKTNYMKMALKRSFLYNISCVKPQNLKLYLCSYHFREIFELVRLNMHRSLSHYKEADVNKKN